MVNYFFEIFKKKKGKWARLPRGSAPWVALVYVAPLRWRCHVANCPPFDLPNPAKFFYKYEMVPPLSNENENENLVKF